MKRKKIGSFYEILLESNLKTLTRHIDNHIFSFYNCFKPKDHVFGESDAINPLFNLYVHNDVFSKSNWKAINFTSRQELPNKESLVFFKQDIFDSNKCWLVDAWGTETRVEQQQCIGYDRLAVWEFQGAEKRLLDYYYGRPNPHLEVLQLKLT